MIGEKGCINNHSVLSLREKNCDAGERPTIFMAERVIL